jgi:hypothetical protein
MPAVPTGRGFWIWRLEHCEGGDVAKVVARAVECGVTWVAVKAFDATGKGSIWKQFTAALVSAFHARGVAVYGWGFDSPDVIDAEIKAVAYVAKCGADGYIFDAEVSWEHDANTDAKATRLCAGARAVVPATFALGHAPFDVIAGHQAFPYTAFGIGVDFVCPQAYWPEHGIGVVKSTMRYLEQWKAYEGHRPQAAKPRLGAGYSIKPSLAGGKSATAADMRTFEAMIAAAGEKGCSYWEWSQTPQEIWAALAGTRFNDWTTQPCG